MFSPVRAQDNIRLSDMISQPLASGRTGMRASARSRGSDSSQIVIHFPYSEALNLERGVGGPWGVLHCTSLDPNVHGIPTGVGVHRLDHDIDILNPECISLLELADMKPHPRHVLSSE